jgi:hypothetical protein
LRRRQTARQIVRVVVSALALALGNRIVRRGQTQGGQTPLVVVVVVAGLEAVLTFSVTEGV